ncbi:MAG: hypothetical protein HFJ40_00820 [Clostridia bacterium]|nr:hypothetical protein [Clostridia bacterium]
MEEKNTIKISLSTFFLILAIIAICIISYFMFEFYNEKNQLETEVVSLNVQNKNFANRISEENQSIENISESSTETTIDTNTKTYSYEDIKGLYRFTTEVQKQVEVFYNLCLYENGTFEYEYGIENQSSIIGNYIIVDDILILNKMFTGGSDVGLRTSSGEIKLKINTNGILTDTNNLLSDSIKERGLNIDLSNITLKKASTQEQQEHLKNFPSIMTHINNSVSNNAVSNS